jgi:dCTP deaminase
MTLLSDRQIKNLCIEKDSYYYADNKKVFFNVEDYAELVKERGSSFEYYKSINSTFKPMISPFVADQVRTMDNNRILSYGTSSYGYDIRLANKFKIFTNINSTVVDPLNFKHESYVDFEGDVCIIPPNSFVLGSTVEYFNVPEDVTGVVIGKSTYARCGVVCICTPLEAGWSGELVVEFANLSPLPVKLYAGHGCAQILWFKGDEPCETSYAKRAGKYQGQTGIQLPIG